MLLYSVRVYILYIVVQALSDYDGHGISCALDWLAGQTVYRKQLAKVKAAGTLLEWFRIRVQRKA